MTPADDENDMGGDFSRDVLIVTSIVYGVIAVLAIVACAAIAWRLA